jgi:beta-lactamase regulating signal transducer with metallopeptidase domain
MNMVTIGNITLPTLTMGIALKSLLVLIGILTLTWFMRRSSAAVRHLYLTAAALVLLALPLASLVLPSWGAGLFSDPFPAKDGKTIVSSAGTDATVRGSGPGFDGGTTPSTPLSPGRKSPYGWFDWVLIVWLTGAVALLFRLVGGKMYGYWVARRAPEIKDNGFINTVEQVARRLGIDGKITVVESDRFNVPFVSGILRPRLIMPPQARTWPCERLEAILHHELAHIKRKDILIQFLAQVVCCIYWINPLVWILERRLFLERERACDDMTLDQNKNIKASEYAGHLMEVLEEMGNTTNTNLWVVTAMAEGTDFKDRILSILNPTAQRRSPKQMQASVVIVFSLFFLLLFSAFSPWAAADLPPEESLEAIATQDSPRGDEDGKPGEKEVGDENKAQLSVLLDALKSSSADVREHAASTLGEWGDRRAVPALIEALRDENAVVREHVASALGKLGDKQAVPPLIEALNDEDAVVREHVAGALGRLGDKRAIQPLLDALKKEQEARVSEHILSALKNLRKDREPVRE